MDLFYRAAHHAVARDVFVGAKYSMRAVIAIDVGGNKIDGDVLLGAVLDEGIGPGGLRRCRTAHAKSRVHPLHRRYRMIVKFPVSRLFWLADPEIDIGFVPDFEVPLGYFIYP